MHGDRRFQKSGAQPAMCRWAGCWCMASSQVIAPYRTRRWRRCRFTLARRRCLGGSTTCSCSTRALCATAIPFWSRRCRSSRWWQRRRAATPGGLSSWWSPTHCHVKRFDCKSIRFLSTVQVFLPCSLSALCSNSPGGCHTKALHRSQLRTLAHLCCITAKSDIEKATSY